MRLTLVSTLSLLSLAVGLSFASTAQAAQPPAPDLSNAVSTMFRRFKKL